MDPLDSVPPPSNISPNVTVVKARPVAPMAVSPTGQVVQKAKPVGAVQVSPVQTSTVQQQVFQPTYVNGASPPMPVYVTPAVAPNNFTNGTTTGVVEVKQVQTVSQPRVIIKAQPVNTLNSPSSGSLPSPTVPIQKTMPTAPSGHVQASQAVPAGKIPGSVVIARPVRSDSTIVSADPNKEPVEALIGSTDPGSALGKAIPESKWETDPRLIRLAPLLFMIERSMLILGGCFWSWLLGRLHWSLAWILVMMLLLAPAHDRALRNSYKRNKLKARLETINDRLETDFESVDWWNIWFSKFWMEYEPSLSKSLATSINNVLTGSKPGFVQSWFLSEFTLGTQAPSIVGVKTYPQVQTDDVCMLLFHIVFLPMDYEDLQAEQAYLRRKRLAARKDPTAVLGAAHDLKNSKMVLKCYFGLGKMRVPVPIELKDVGFEGQFIVRFKFGPTWPHIQVMNVWFPEEYGPPQLDFSLKPLKGLDVYDIPGLKGFINSLVESQSRKFLQFPGYTYSFAQGPDQAALANLSAGVLRISIYQARGLPNVDTLQGVSDPFVEVKLGTTGAQKVVMITRVVKDK
jgi:hypothetical protein